MENSDLKTGLETIERVFEAGNAERDIRLKVLIEMKDKIQKEIDGLSEEVRKEHEMLLESSIIDFSFADMNNMRFHPEAVKDGTISSSKNSARRKDAWSYKADAPTLNL